jgi:negative regulator of sigma E activity
MSDDIDSQLSRFADGDLDRERASFLIHRLAHDPKLKAKWSRLHLIGATLKGDAANSERGGFAERVMTALESEREPASLALPQAAARKPRAWLKPASGFALAATVASAMVGGVWLSDRENGTAPSVAATPNTPSVAPTTVDERALAAQYAPPIAAQSVASGSADVSAFGSELSRYLATQRSTGVVWVNGQPMPLTVVRMPAAPLQPTVDAPRARLVSESR